MVDSLSPLLSAICVNKNFHLLAKFLVRKKMRREKIYISGDFSIATKRDAVNLALNRAHEPDA